MIPNLSLTAGFIVFFIVASHVWADLLPPWGQPHSYDWQVIVVQAAHWYATLILGVE